MDTQEPAAEVEEAQSWPRRAYRWIRARPVLVLVVLAALIGGPLFTGFVFPDAGPVKQVFGGWLLGLYWTVCAVPEKFMD